MNFVSLVIPILSFFFLSHFLALAIKPPYTPIDNILVNCGSSLSNTTIYGRSNWNGDNVPNSKFSLMEPPNNKSKAAAATSLDSSVNFNLYNTARISRSRFTYTFTVAAGQKFIRLYFRPTSYNQGFDRDKDFFDVTAGRFTLLRNFSATLYAKDWQTETFPREFCINVEESRLLNITFAPFLTDSNDSYAFINGIEIMSMPTDLYYTPSGSPGLTFAGQNRRLYVKNDSALEMVCRLNVGGTAIAPTADTGMYRSWTDDVRYFYPYGFVAREPDISLRYSKIPPYAAPDDLYISGRTMGLNRTRNLLSNLTWLVLIDVGFRYLLRLHFCEFVPQVTKINDRVFNIMIDNKTVEVGFDVIRLSGGNNIPMYKDYIVEPDSWQLFIALHPNGSADHYADAILNGLEVFKLSNRDGNLAAGNYESPAPPPAPMTPSTTGKKSSTREKIFIVVGGSVMGLLMILSLFCCMAIWRLRKRKRYGSYNYEPLPCCWWLIGKLSTKTSSSLPAERCRYFSLAEIEAATNDFHKDFIIGIGGFGNVYKGTIDGEKLVAIKRLNPESRQGAHEFVTEIEMLSQLRHVHLVPLIGFCHDGGEMILVYEYMSNGTLRDHLYETNNDPIPWKQRLEICIGAASGLDYLHTGVTNTIIHRDVKTTNILLDENFVAKVSDFGLSKIGMTNAAVSTAVKGTPGYLDPEYARTWQLTEKSDVYSFGVILLEVLCARKPVNLKLEQEQKSLALWARKCIQNGTIHQIIDPYLMGRISPECFKKYMEIADRCLRELGVERPTMHDVLEKLQFALELQKAADAENEATDPGGQYLYPETSFHDPGYTVVGGGKELETSDTSDLISLETDATGLTFPTLESGSIKSSQSFFDSTSTTA